MSASGGGFWSSATTAQCEAGKSAASTPGADSSEEPGSATADEVSQEFCPSLRTVPTASHPSRVRRSLPVTCARAAARAAWPSQGGGDGSWFTVKALRGMAELVGSDLSSLKGDRRALAPVLRRAKRAETPQITRSPLGSAAGTVGERGGSCTHARPVASSCVRPPRCRRRCHVDGGLHP